MEEASVARYRLFADLLSCPTASLPARARECASLLASVDGDAADLVDRFRDFLEETTPGRLEEIHAGVFDLQPICCPYVGYHLFGEHYRRGVFMARLREHYRAHSFPAGEELPDHIVVLLRYLAGRHDEETDRDLVTECLLPAAEKMVKGFADGTNPYRGILEALVLLLRRETAESGENADSRLEAGR